MKHRPLKQLCGLIATAAIALALVGCNGKDGQIGANGTNGTNGVNGVNGTNGVNGVNGVNGTNGVNATTTSEACIVCHNSNDVADPVNQHKFVLDTVTNTRTKDRIKEGFLTVAITKVEDAAGKPKITFTVKNGSAAYTKVTKEWLGRIIIADLVPAGATGNANQTPFFEQWAYEAGTNWWAAGAVTFDNTSAATGTYAVTLPQAWGTTSIATPYVTKAAPTTIVTTGASTSASNVGYNATHPQRVYLRVGPPSATQMVVTTGAGTIPSTIATTGNTNLTAPTYTSYVFPSYASYQGTDYTNGYTLNLNNVNTANVTYDIAAVPATGLTAAAYTGTGTTATFAKQEVTIEACQKCHGVQMAAAAHASSYSAGGTSGVGATLSCALCHSPLSQIMKNSSSGNGRRVDRMFHLIHGADIEAQTMTQAGVERASYPQVATDCTACHTTSTKTLGAGDSTTAWQSTYSVEACGACHTSVNFTTGVGHSALNIKAVNGSCIACHDGNTAPTSTSAHTNPTANPGRSAADKYLDGANKPEYTAAMTVTQAKATGKTATYYEAGDTMTVAVTLTAANGTPAVAGTIYTTTPHAAGSTVANVLSKAVLYVYGPRALPVPVLTKASATLSAAGVPGQSQSLFPATTDAAITTSSTGFGYKMTIPAGMTPGTYMVRFIAANYGYKADTDYRIDSTAFATFQVGTATSEAKISGNACTDCHGTGNLEAHNARHSVVFDTDQCIACHDRSGNTGDPIHNRVHAIHSATQLGDNGAHFTNWSSVLNVGQTVFNTDGTANAIFHTVGYPQGKPSITASAVTGSSVETDTLGVLGVVGATVTTPLGSLATDVTTASGYKAVTSTGAPRCIGCHTSGNTAYQTRVSGPGCYACHADKTGVNDHFLQMGGKTK